MTIALRGRLSCRESLFVVAGSEQTQKEIATPFGLAMTTFGVNGKLPPMRIFSNSVGFPAHKLCAKESGQISFVFLIINSRTKVKAANGI